MTSERPQHGDMMARMKLEGSLCTKYVHCTGLKTTAAQKMKKKIYRKLLYLWAL